MMWWLGFLICVFANRKNHQRMCLLAACYATQWAHLLLFSGYSDAGYFLTAASTDAITVILLRLFRPSALSLHLQIINAWSAITQAVGWIAYESYIDPTYYNTAIFALGMVQIIRLLIVTDDDSMELDGGDQVDFIRKLVRCFAGVGYQGRDPVEKRT